MTTRMTVAEMVGRWQALSEGELLARVAGVGATLAQQGQAAAQQNATERLTMRSGALYNSISGTARPLPAGVHVALMAGGPGAEHAVYQELGTRGRTPSPSATADHPSSSFSIPPAGTVGAIPAKHYLRDAFQAQQAETAPRLQRTLTEGLIRGR